MKKIMLSKNANRYLAKIDKNTRNRIITAIKGLQKKPMVGDIKKLKGEMNNQMRLRVGEFRVLFEIKYDIIEIIDIGARGGIYK